MSVSVRPATAWFHPVVRSPACVAGPSPACSTGVIPVSFSECASWIPEFWDTGIRCRHPLARVMVLKFPEVVGTLIPTLPAGLEEVLDVLGQELRPSGEVAGNQLPGCNAILNCPHRNNEYVGNVPDGVCRLDGEPFDPEHLLQ